jgi:hypothetical protein
VEPFPEDVTTFMYENVETIDQLEILRILGEDRQKEWDHVALAREVQAPPEVVRAHLTAMHTRGLLTATPRERSLSCRYGVSTPELEHRVGRLLEMYKERPVTMIKMVYERAYDPLRAFSDSFRIRKEE